MSSHAKDEAIMIAYNITRGDRQRDYDHPLRNMVRIAIRQTITHRNELREGIAINPYQATLAMVDVKLAREEATPKRDNIVDTIGYTDMVDRMANKLIELHYALDYNHARSYFDGWSLEELCRFLDDLDKRMLEQEDVPSI